MKAFIKEDIKESFFAIVFVVIVILGITLGFRIGSFIEDLPSTGAFTSWELLDSPVKFTQITYINFTGVWAQTTEDKLLFWNFCYGQNDTMCNQWVVATNTPNDAQEDDHSGMIKGKSCPDSSNYPKKYPGEITECALVVLPRGSGLNSAYFVLLNDGTLWEWSPPGGTDVPIIALVVGPSIGLVLGIIVGVWFLRLKKKKV